MRIEIRLSIIKKRQQNDNKPAQNNNRMTNTTIKVENKIETIICRLFYFWLFYFSVFYGGNPQFQIFFASLIKFSIAVVFEDSVKIKEIGN